MAALFGIQHLVEYYLYQGANIDARDSAGKTALHKASENGHVAVVQVLLDSGATVSLQDIYGRDALLWAVSENRLSVAHLLLQNGAEVKIVSDEVFPMCGYSYAAENGFEEMLEVLAGSETDVSRLNKGMTSALHSAVLSKHHGVIRYLIQGPNKWSYSKQFLASLMGKAVRHGISTTVMQILFEAGADVNLPCLVVRDSPQDADILWYNSPPLHGAVKQKYLEGVTFLLAHAADVNAIDNKGDTALVRACRSEFRAVSVDTIRIVHQLLDKGADPAIADSKYGRMPLEWAIIRGNEDLAWLLLQHEYRSADQKNLMLYLTSLYYNILLTNGEDVDQILCQKQVEELGTLSKLLLIYIPADRGYERVVRKFLEAGAALEPESPQGMTALHLATREGHVAVVELLLANEANINSANRSGMTALHLAAEGGHGAIIELLLAKGANINSGDRTKDGTPLMIAARAGNTDIVDHLLRRGADIDAFSKDCFYGCSALAQAIGRGNMAIATLLLEKGANPNGQFRGIDGSTLLHHLARNHLQYDPFEYLLPAHRRHRTFGLSHDRLRSTIDILLDNGADQEARDTDDRTPLALSVRWENLEAAQLLSERGANLEAKDKFGFTPLVLAVRTGNLKVVQFLLDEGVDPHSLPPRRTRDYEDVSEDDFRSAVKLVLEAQSKTIGTSIEKTVQEIPTRQETGPLPMLSPDRDTASENLDREDFHAGDSVANRRNSL